MLFERTSVQFACAALALLSCASSTPDPMEEQQRLLAEERAMVRERDAQAQAKCFEFRSVVSACVNRKQVVRPNP